MTLGFLSHQLAAFRKRRSRRKKNKDGEASGEMSDYSESATSDASSVTDFSEQGSGVHSLSYVDVSTKNCIMLSSLCL